MDETLEPIDYKYFRGLERMLPHVFFNEPIPKFQKNKKQNKRIDRKQHKKFTRFGIVFLHFLTKREFLDIAF